MQEPIGASCSVLHLVTQRGNQAANLGRLPHARAYKAAPLEGRNSLLHFLCMLDNVLGAGLPGGSKVNRCSRSRAVLQFVYKLSTCWINQHRDTKKKHKQQPKAKLIMGTGFGSV